MRILANIFLGIILLATIVGCQAQDRSKGLLGKWELVELTLQNGTKENKQTGHWNINANQMEFFSDNTFTQRRGNGSGRWNILDDGRIKLTHSQYGRVSVGTIQNEKLLLDYDNNEKEVWEKIKASKSK